MYLISIYQISSKYSNKYLYNHVKLVNIDNILNQLKEMITQIMDPILQKIEKEEINKHVSSKLKDIQNATNIEEILEILPFKVIDHQMNYRESQFSKCKLLCMENCITSHDYHYFLDIRPISFNETCQINVLSYN